MIRHIVWWTLKPEAMGKKAHENAIEAKEQSKMLHGIAFAQSIEVSITIEPSTTVPAQVVLMSAHADMAALNAYKNDPAHVKFAELITAISDSRNCIDYQV